MKDVEDKLCHPNPPTTTTTTNNNDDATIGILRTFRDIPPADYSFKIEAFSLLLDTEAKVIESGHFETGGYKWRLSFYPCGNQQGNENGHISLYLSMVETDDLPLAWNVDVNFKFFVFDQIRDKYLTIRDADGKLRRFHRMKTEWGFAQLLSLKAFNDTSNGYLHNDCCIFGVEIFVIKPTGKGESLSMVTTASKWAHAFEIEKYSDLNQDCIYSELFTLAGKKWKLLLYPKGDKRAKESLSLYLRLDESETLPLKRKLYAKYMLRMIDQCCGNHCEEKAEHWFDIVGQGYGYSSFVPLSDLKDKSKGYIYEDRMIVEVELEVISVVKDFS